MEPKRPAKSVSRPRDTTKVHKQTQNGIKSTQSNPLLFINISNPAERKRKDSRKAVRSFVMKQYQRSQKTVEPLQVREMELEEGEDDAVEEVIGNLQPAEDADNSQSLTLSDNDHDVGESSIISRQHRFSSSDSIHTGHCNTPLSILGCGSLDPFDSYPSQIDMRAHQLIDMCT